MSEASETIEYSIVLWFKARHRPVSAFPERPVLHAARTEAFIALCVVTDPLVRLQITPFVHGCSEIPAFHNWETPSVVSCERAAEHSSLA